MPGNHRLDLNTAAYTALAEQSHQLGMQAPVKTDELRDTLVAAVLAAGITSPHELEEEIRAAVAGPYDGTDVDRAAVVAHLLRNRFCGVPDGGQPLLNYGATGVPWDGRALTWHVNPDGAELLDVHAGPWGIGGGGGADPDAIVRDVTRRAFALWENALPGHFTFSEVAQDADIEIDFSLDPSDEAAGRGKGPSEPVSGVPYRQRGTVRLQRNFRMSGAVHEQLPWGETTLGFVLVHEIGHVLGLQHSNLRGSLMFPYAIGDGWAFSPIDDETSEVLRDMYGWEYRPFRDGRTSAYPPSVARTSPRAGFAGGPHAGGPVLHMVWTGPQGVADLAYSRSRDSGTTWTDGRPMSWPSGATPVHGTALTGYCSSDDPAPDRLFLAWAGEGEQLWFAPDLDDPAALSVAKVPGHTSDRRPALTATGRVVHMAWKSNGDQRVWWATYERGSWSTAVAIPHLITEEAPTIGLDAGRVHVVVRNPNSSLLVECELMPDGRWTSPRAVTTFNYEGGPGNTAQAGESPSQTTTTSHGPSSTTTGNGALMLAFRRRNGRLATLRKGGSGGGAVPAWRHFSDRAPAIAGAGRQLVLVWVGPDQRLAYAVREPGIEVAGTYDGPGSLDLLAEVLRDL